ncbi:MAG: hypothetical protein WCE51_09685 [Chthoniobacterales bacterium]
MNVHDGDAHSVFYFAGSKVVQERSPLFVFFEILGDMLGKENVPGIATIHHPLRHVDAGARDIIPATHVGHFADRSAMYSHSHSNLRMPLERLCNLQRTARRFLRAVAKNERHPIARRKPNELFVRRFAHLRGVQYDLGETAQPFLLLFNQQL